MRLIGLSLIILAVLATGSLMGCSPKQDAKIRERTDLGMSDLVKAKDMGLESTVRATLAGDPICKFYGLDCKASHDVVTLIGKVKTEKQKQDAYELVMSIDLSRIKKENIINEIEVDPSLDEPPFEW